MHDLISASTPQQLLTTHNNFNGVPIAKQPLAPSVGGAATGNRHNSTGMGVTSCSPAPPPVAWGEWPAAVAAMSAAFAQLVRQRTVAGAIRKVRKRQKLLAAERDGADMVPAEVALGSGRFGPAVVLLWGFNGVEVERTKRALENAGIEQAGWSIAVSNDDSLTLMDALNSAKRVYVGEVWKKAMYFFTSISAPAAAVVSSEDERDIQEGAKVCILSGMVAEEVSTTVEVVNEVLPGVAFCVAVSGNIDRKVGRLAQEVWTEHIEVVSKSFLQDEHT